MYGIASERLTAFDCLTVPRTSYFLWKLEYEYSNRAYKIKALRPSVATIPCFELTDHYEKEAAKLRMITAITLMASLGVSYAPYQQAPIHVKVIVVGATVIPFIITSTLKLKLSCGLSHAQATKQRRNRAIPSLSFTITRQTGNVSVSFLILT